MKLKIDRYDVNISVKRTNETQCTKGRTYELLNELATFCCEASDSYEKNGLSGLSKEARQIFNYIYMMHLMKRVCMIDTNRLP